MSTNGQLVFTDVDKITFKGVGNTSNAVVDTLTGKIGVGTDSPEANLHVLGNSYVSTNLELGGTLIMGTVNVEAQHSLEAVTATGNITPLTLEFTNPTTSLVASGNVEVGGNVVAGYLYGDGSNITGISSNLDQIVNIGNVTSNTVQFTNPTTSLVASGNVEVGGDVVLSGNIYNNANLSVQYTTITPTLWTQVGQDIDGEAAGDESGNSVSMSSDGTRVAIGAWGNDPSTGSNAGHVRVYERGSGASLWTQVADIDGEAAGDWSGWSVSMSSDGTRVAIGAKYNDGTGSAAGHVRVYAESSGTWTQLGSDIDGEAASDESGYSVSISSDGTRVAIGAPLNDGTSAADTRIGNVRVYEWDNVSWSKVGSDIDGEAADDRSGYSVSMSSDGTRVAIGAARNGSTGSDAGHVRVYAESSGTWTQVGNDIDGEAAGDWSGWSVSMSSDGTRVAIGAPYNHGNGSDAGHVRVFDWQVKSKKILKDDIVEVGGELTVSGNVGIGTPSPLETLDTHGTMRSSAPYPRLDFYTTTNRSTNAWGNSTDNAGDYRIYSNGDASDGTKRSLNFDYGQNSTHTTRMAINASGFVGIRTTSPSFPLSVSDASVKQWNAFNNNTSAGDYTFTQSGIYLVGFMYGDATDGNTCEYYTITAATSHGGSCGVTQHKDSSYLNYDVQDHNIVRFWSGSPSNALPPSFNSSNFHLRIYFAGYF
jgi:hypothetical protein